MESGADAVVPGASLVTGLANYGPLGIILGIFLLVGIYVFKRLFDRVLASADASKDTTAKQLDSIVAGIDRLRQDFVEEMRSARNEVITCMNLRYRAESNTPLPQLPDLPRGGRHR